MCSRCDTGNVTPGEGVIPFCSRLTGSDVHSAGPVIRILDLSDSPVPLLNAGTISTFVRENFRQLFVIFRLKSFVVI